jgi:hypothetical protein
MRRIAVAVASAMWLAAGAARADDQDAKDRDFERAAAVEAAEAERAGLAAPSGTTAELARIEERRKAKEASPWGLLVEGGFPEGLAASVVFRPVSEVRLWAGPAWNYVGWGVHGGVTVIPWHTGISPFLSLGGGRYFSADARFLAGSSGVPEEVEPLLTNVSYDFLNARVGIEIGTRNAFAITIAAGLSYVALDAEGTTTTEVDAGGGTTATVTFTDPRLRGTVPSANVGIQLWF